MLKSIRVTIAGLFFACLTALFLDFTGTLHAWLGWMAKIQFLPGLKNLPVLRVPKLRQEATTSDASNVFLIVRKESIFPVHCTG